MNLAVLRRALIVTLMSALPIAGAWSLVLWLVPENREHQRLLGIGIYAIAVAVAVLLGRRLRQREENS